MDRAQLAELHYITPIENLPSIRQHGVLSHHRAAGLQHRSVAMTEIQARRSGKRVPGGRPLHEYANLYINARNVMLSKVLHEASIDEVCVLRISADVVDLPDVVIADQNAASDYVRFTRAPDGLARIDNATVFSEYWTPPGRPDRRVASQVRHVCRSARSASGGGQLHRGGVRREPQGCRQRKGARSRTARDTRRLQVLRMKEATGSP